MDVNQYLSVMAETRKESADLLREWAETFGDYPTAKAIKAILREGADIVERGEL